MKNLSSFSVAVNYKKVKTSYKCNTIAIIGTCKRYGKPGMAIWPVTWLFGIIIFSKQTNRLKIIL